MTSIPIHYDLILAVQRMEEIKEMISSPILNPIPPARKKRKKIRNNTTCDSCREEGNLIGCTICPAAFHLICHDPPLAKDALSIKKWLCCRCKATREVPNEPPSTSSSRNIDSDVINPFDALISEALTSNPSQYQLPSDLAVNVKFPGSLKKEKSKKKKKSSAIKLCYKCSRSSLRGPLVQCDYCPLLFHCDCLEPPLTNLPGPSRWMCPNHPEHILDEKLLKTVGLSKRVKLWTKCSAPVNQNAVKLQFLNKINMRDPPFRSKVKLPPRKSTSVPGAIKQFYSLPPSLLPRSKDPIPSLSTDTSVGESMQWYCKIANLRQEISKCLSLHQNTADTSFIKKEMCDPDQVVIKTEICDSDDNTANPCDAVEVDSERPSTSHWEGVEIKVEPPSSPESFTMTFENSEDSQSSIVESQGSSSQGSEVNDNSNECMHMYGYPCLPSKAQTSACSDEIEMEAGPSTSMPLQCQQPLPTEWC